MICARKIKYLKKNNGAILTIITAVRNFFAGIFFCCNLPICSAASQFIKSKKQATKTNEPAPNI